MFEALQTKLGYRFKNPELLRRAFIHTSWLSDNRQPITPNADNQRLEFLGDAVLNLLTACRLYECYPDADEGRLTILRSRLTSGSALAVKARELELGTYVHLSSGEVRQGGREKESVLQDALEALFGAIWIDGGLEAAQELYNKLYSPQAFSFEALPEVRDNNPKSELQFVAQRKYGLQPAYEIVAAEGPGHNPVYTARASIGSVLTVEAQGNSKKAAQVNAAQKLLELCLEQPQKN